MTTTFSVQFELGSGWTYKALTPAEAKEKLDDLGAQAMVQKGVTPFFGSNRERNRELAEELKQEILVSRRF